METSFEYCPYCGYSVEEYFSNDKVEKEDLNFSETDLELDNSFESKEKANKIIKKPEPEDSRGEVKNKSKFNWWAFLFRGLWYIFHGMMGKGIFIFVIGIFLSFIHPILLLGLSIYCGVNAESDLANKSSKRVEDKQYLKGDSKELENKLFNYAKKTVNPDSIIKLAEKDVDINIRDNKGKTPLMYAAQFNKNAAISRFLLKFGADINIKDKKGMTALMYGCSSNRENVISTLLRNNPDLKTKNNDGKRALDYAKSNNELKQKFIDNNLVSS